MKKKDLVFNLVKKQVEKVSGYKYQVNYHIVISIMEALTDLVTYGEIIVTVDNKEVSLFVPNNFSFRSEKHIKILKQNCRKILKFYMDGMYCRTGAKTDKNKFK